MINIAECEIDSDRLSVEGVNTLQQIIDKIDNANLLTKVMGIIPFIDIFLKGKPHEKLTNIAAYDWKEFSRVMRSIHAVERKVIAKLAFDQALESTGKEHEFWKCVYNAM